MRRALLLGFLALAGCTSEVRDGAEAGDRAHEPTSSIDATCEALTVDARVDRYTKMRDAARAHGIPANGFLLAGIAYDETGIAMCWSEATWACKGPSSPDCGGGPVIAGAADGACGNERGGLGLFQFDAGTHADTLAKYGAGILTIDGQIEAAIAYVTDMVAHSAYIANVDTPETALAWLNAFDPADATAKDQWIKTVVRYYNGCQPTSTCWKPRVRTYSEGLATALADTGGAAFWSAAPPPAPVPPPGPSPESSAMDRTDGAPRATTKRCH